MSLTEELVWFFSRDGEPENGEEVAIWNLYQLGLIAGPDPSFKAGAPSDYALTNVGKAALDMCATAYEWGVVATEEGAQMGLIEDFGPNPFNGETYEPCP